MKSAVHLTVSFISVLSARPHIFTSLWRPAASAAMVAAGRRSTDRQPAGEEREESSGEGRGCTAGLDAVASRNDTKRQFCKMDQQLGRSTTGSSL